MLAVWHGHTEIVKMLLEDSLGRVNVNAANYEGETALMWAARKGLADIVQILLRDSRIDVNQVKKKK